MYLIRCVAIALALVVLGSAEVGAQEITLSVAVSLKDAVEELGRGFMAVRPGVRLRYNFGASGDLQKQIEAGAPIDLFLSAAQRQMDELEKQNLIIPASRRAFARNALVVIKPADSRVDITKPADLLDPRVARIVIGNPKSVPAGQYAEEKSTHAGSVGSPAAEAHLLRERPPGARLRGARRGRRRIRLHDGRRGACPGGERSVPPARRQLSTRDLSGRGRGGIQTSGAGADFPRPSGRRRRSRCVGPLRLPAAAGRGALIAGRAT